MTETAVAVNHLSLNEIKMKVQMSAGSLRIRKWLVIYNAIVDPRPVSEIALHTGFSEAGVQKIIKEYNRIGPEFIEKPNIATSIRNAGISTKKGQANEQECTENTRHWFDRRTESHNSEAHGR